MSKTLTIEELKALEVGDWVWVEAINAPNSLFRGYYQIRPNAERSKLIFCGIEHDYSITDYGTKWLAYKNKEQAETKGEWVELPKDKWVITRHAGKKTKYTYQVEHVEPYAEFIDGAWYIGMGYNPYRKTIEEYDTKDQAEARLKELRGEK